MFVLVLSKKNGVQWGTNIFAVFRDSTVLLNKCTPFFFQRTRTNNGFLNSAHKSASKDKWSLNAMSEINCYREISLA